MNITLRDEILPFLYIWIDETTKLIRVIIDNELFRNDIRVQHDTTNYTDHLLKIGKKRTCKNLYFNFLKEYSISKENKDKENEKYLLTFDASNIEKWESFKKCIM